jgi:DNA-binding beta-propeller fold protein YncE
VLPDRLALSRSGRRLLVSHGGHGAHTISEVDTRTGRVRTFDVGGAATAVAYGPSGSRLAALLGADAIAVIDAHGRRRVRRTVTGPRGLAVLGRHAFTVSSVDATIGKVRT